MADDLDRLMDSIESEGPSPEFVAELRARIVAETSPAADGDDPVVPIRARSPRAKRNTTRWIPVGMVAAAVLLIIGLVVVSRNDDGLEPIDQPEPSPPTTTQAPAPFVADAVPIAQESSVLEPGAYRVDALGTPLSLTIDEPLRGSSETASLFLAHPDSQDLDDRTIRVIRLTALSNPARPIVAPGDATTTWPAEDLDGWLATVTDEVVVTNRVETMLGGLAATRFDLELGVTECVVGDESCAWFSTNRMVRDVELLPESQYQIWVVDQDNADPLGVIAAIDRASDRDWFDTAEAIVSTFAFGEIAPNPILAGDVGPVELPVLGGVTVDVPDGSFVLRDPSGIVRVVLDDWPGETTFVTDLLDDDGTPLESADDVVAALRASGADLTELEPTVGGVEVRVFDVEAASPTPTASLRIAADPGGSWNLPPRGRLWLVDHPDRGLLVIAAGAVSNLDIVTPLVVDQATTLVESLAFAESG